MLAGSDRSCSTASAPCTTYRTRRTGAPRVHAELAADGVRVGLRRASFARASAWLLDLEYDALVLVLKQPAHRAQDPRHARSAGPRAAAQRPREIRCEAGGDPW